MKKTLVLSILGVAATSAFAQGLINVSNYLVPPYAQVVWGSHAPVGLAGHAVAASAGLTFQVYYGLGVDTSYAQLTAGNTFQIDGTISATYDPGVGYGPGGYFINNYQVVPGWNSGGTITLGYAVITPNYTGSSALWQESASYEPTNVSPNSSQSIGDTVSIAIPEPTTLAFLGMGALGLLALRRR